MSEYRMKMPDLGEGVVEAELVTWYVRVGDEVTSETQIAEVLTDKASVDVSAPVHGVISALLVDAGAIITVGSDLLIIERDGHSEAASRDLKDEQLQIDADMPSMHADELLPDHSPGVKHKAQTGTPHESAMAESATTSTLRSAPTRPAPATTRRPEPSGPVGTDSSSKQPPPRALAAPTVRRRARELDIDLGSIKGSGPRGRVLVKDLNEHQERSTVTALQRRPDEAEQIRGIRRTIAHRLTTSWQAPHITYVDSVDITELDALRVAVNEELDGTGRRTTILPFIARAVVMACVDHPKINSTYDADTEILCSHGAIHLGMATQTDRGLLVPVITDADQRSLFELTDEIRELAKACRDNTVARDRLTGSTITLTSLGALGGIMNTPILNAPEVAIVGINKMQVQPKWNGSSFVPRSTINISSSFDHRIIDGWDAARFIQRVKHLLETPALLTLGWMR
jgi:2-oxoisovalerate dehydrogenase E2 component (dihydrolipoyl transacylase)